MKVLVLAVLVVALVALVRGMRYRLGSRRFWTLHGLADSVCADLGFPPPSGQFVFGPLEHLVLNGAIPGGRMARVSFARARRAPVVRLAVACDEAPRLSMLEATPLRRVGRWFGIGAGVPVGDRAFDDRFHVTAFDPERVRRAMSPHLRWAIGRVFDAHPVLLLAIEEGRLFVDLPRHVVEPRRYREVLEHLEEVAVALDRAPVTVRVLGGERRALRDRSGSVRCAYCHEGITGEEEALVACEVCSTVLHAPCWDEHGGCPIFGCRGVRPERSRTT